jgi:hypothetical protein
MYAYASRGLTLPSTPSDMSDSKHLVLDKSKLKCGLRAAKGFGTLVFYEIY